MGKGYKQIGGSSGPRYGPGYCGVFSVDYALLRELAVALALLAAIAIAWMAWS